MSWDLHELRNKDELFSPSLLINPDLVRENVNRMIAIAGRTERLRPHLKTHKMPEIVRLLESLGIRRHKCATIAEAEMAARAGATDVLLAYPLVGPNLGRFARLLDVYPRTTWRAVVDNLESARHLLGSLGNSTSSLRVLVDLEIGMGRTGLAPDDQAFELYEAIHGLTGLIPDGLHAYDGHIHDTDLGHRRDAAKVGQEQTLALRDRLLRRGLEVPRLVMGGTPCFPIHAELDVPGLELSPGTIVLHDHGYATRYPDLPFQPAAVLLTRVISHPRPGRMCLDLGHKAVAADPAGPRLFLPQIPDAHFVSQSEEHLVLETDRTGGFPVGTPLVAIPTHICPTVALHRRAYVISNGACQGEWEVAARDRVISL